MAEAPSRSYGTHFSFVTVSYGGDRLDLPLPPLHQLIGHGLNRSFMAEVFRQHFKG